MTTLRTTIALPLAVTALMLAATASLAAESQLKWTPHRANAQPAAVAPELVEAPAPLPSQPSTAPAAVVLPDSVPASPAPRQAMRRAAPATRPQPAVGGGWQTPNPIAGTFQRVFDTSDESRVFGMPMRTPQGDASRSILAPEGQQAEMMQRRAAAVELTAGASDRLGGGLAPRYSATPGSRLRIDRIATGSSM